MSYEEILRNWPIKPKDLSLKYNCGHDGDRFTWIHDDYNLTVSKGTLIIGRKSNEM